MTLATSIPIPTALIVALICGFVLALFKVAEYLVGRYANGRRQAVNPNPHWTDVTGEVRPVTMQECAARHTTLTEELKKGSEKMERLDSSFQEVRDAVKSLESKVGAEVELRIRSYADEAVDAHEKGLMHRNSKDSGPLTRKR
jgi:hypothetical protein